MNKNEKLFGLYRVFGYDYLFYTVIVFLYLTQTKGISVGEVMYISAFYAVFSAIMQIPCNYLMEIIGLKKSMVLGNVFLIIHCLIYIFSPKFEFFVVAELFCAIGFCLKNISESPMLYSSLKRSGRQDYFGKIEGKSVSKFFYIEAITSCFVGVLFSVNNYIPIICTLISIIIALIISTKFDDVEIQREDEKQNLKHYFNGIKLVMKSKRVISIFLYVFVVTGLIEVIKVIQKDSVVNLQVNSIQYSLIFALLTFCMGIGSSMQYRIEKYTKRKTLTVIGILISTLLVILGFFMNVFDVSKFLVYSVIIILVIQNVLQGTYRISIKKYLNNFTTSKIRGKIFSIFYIFEGVGKALILFLSGTIINKIGSNYTAIIIGLIAFLLIIYVTEFMKKRLGRDPYEYDSDDIFGADIK